MSLRLDLRLVRAFNYLAISPSLFRRKLEGNFFMVEYSFCNMHLHLFSFGCKLMNLIHVGLWYKSRSKSFLIPLIHNIKYHLFQMTTQLTVETRSKTCCTDRADAAFINTMTDTARNIMSLKPRKI